MFRFVTPLSLCSVPVFSSFVVFRFVFPLRLRYDIYGFSVDVVSIMLSLCHCIVFRFVTPLTCVPLQICQLVEDVQRLQSQLSELENQSVCQRAKLEEELSQKSSIIQRLEAIIEQQKDYEELKKEFS